MAFPPGHQFAALEGIRPADMDGQAYVRRLSCEYRAYIADMLTSKGAKYEVSYQSEREDIAEANAMVFQICGTFSIVRSSMSPRSVSTSAGRSSSFQTRSQSGM